MGKRNSNLHFRFSFTHATRKTEFEISFSFSVFLLHWKWNSNLYFRFSFSHYFGKQNCNCHFRFLISRFRKTLKNKIWTSVFLLLSYFTMTGRMLAFPALKRKLKQILFSILASQDSYIDLSEIVQHVKSWQSFSWSVLTIFINSSCTLNILKLDQCNGFFLAVI